MWYPNSLLAWLIMRFLIWSFAFIRCVDESWTFLIFERMDYDEELIAIVENVPKGWTWNEWKTALNTDPRENNATLYEALCKDENGFFIEWL